MPHLQESQQRFVLVQDGSRQRALARETEETQHWQGVENETKHHTTDFQIDRQDRKHILDWIPTGCRGRGKGKRI